MDKKRSLLWEIRKDTRIRGYLFGTMHIPGKIAFPNFDTLVSNLAFCDAFMSEMLMDQDHLQALNAKILLSSSNSWSARVSDHHFSRMDQIFSKCFNTSLRNFEQVIPIMVLNMMTQWTLGVHGQSTSEPMDLELWQMAETLNLDMLAAESTQQHCAVLDEIPLDFQVQMLKKALRNVAKFRRQTNALHEAYLNQDIHLLYAKSKKSLGNLRNLMLYQRNKLMLNNVIQALEHQKVFVAIGAAHLSGQTGLISQLKKHRFSMKALPEAMI